MCACVCVRVQTDVYGCRGEGQEVEQGAQTSVLGTRIQAAVDTNNELVCYHWGLKTLWECTLVDTVI